MWHWLLQWVAGDWIETATLPYPLLKRARSVKRPMRDLGKLEAS